MSRRSPRVVLFGSGGGFTVSALAGMCAGGFAPAAILRAAPARGPAPGPSPIAVESDDALGSRAAANGIAVEHLDTHDPAAVHERLHALDPDLVVIACYPRRLEARSLAVAPMGTVNVHPSELPRYRGVAPVFWQLRDGASTVGVTVHRATAALDAGPILAARTLPLAEAGTRASDIERTLATAGGHLVARLLVEGDGALAAGQAQDEQLATRQRAPRESDFELDSGWTATRALRFIEGTREWGVAHRVRCADGVVTVRRVVAVHPSSSTAKRASRDTVMLPFADSLLEVVARE